METVKPIALLSWSLDVDCPHCGGEVDLVAYDSENDHGIANLIFNNRWDDVAGREVTCPKCNAEFELGKVGVLIPMNDNPTSGPSDDSLWQEYGKRAGLLDARGNATAVVRANSARFAFMEGLKRARELDAAHPVAAEAVYQVRFKTERAAVDRSGQRGLRLPFGVPACELGSPHPLHQPTPHHRRAGERERGGCLCDDKCRAWNPHNRKPYNRTLSEYESRPRIVRKAHRSAEGRGCMKWRSTTFDWKRRFALLPILVDGHYYWWVWYWKRFACDCNEIEFTQEKPPAEVERVAEETIDDLALAIHARNRHTDLPTVRFWVQQVINQQERKGGDHHGK